MKTIYKNFPETIKYEIVQFNWNSIAEIRLRINKPLIINLVNGKEIISSEIVDEETLNYVFNSITDYSAYAYEETLKSGYLTLPEGHRVGFGGQVQIENGKIKAMKNICYLNFRISHFIKDCGVDLIKYIINGQDIYDTLIVSPPGLGKTTLLRDLIRLLSEELKGKSVSVIDERDEISGSYKGIPSIDLGLRTDVISGCMKVEGILMAIRSLGPSIVAVDEIGGMDDIEALIKAKKSGVRILATMHGKSKEDVVSKLGHANIFEKYIIIKERGVYECL